MKTYELYFSGSSLPDDKFPYAPTVEHMYADFIQTIHSSGYNLKSASLKYTKNKKFATIEVTGWK